MGYIALTNIFHHSLPTFIDRIGLLSVLLDTTTGQQALHHLSTICFPASLRTDRVLNDSSAHHTVHQAE